MAFYFNIACLTFKAQNTTQPRTRISLLCLLRISSRELKYYSSKL